MASGPKPEAGCIELASKLRDLHPNPDSDFVGANDGCGNLSVGDFSPRCRAGNRARRFGEVVAVRPISRHESAAGVVHPQARPRRLGDRKLFLHGMALDLRRLCPFRLDRVPHSDGRRVDPAGHLGGSEHPSILAPSLDGIPRIVNRQ